MCVCVCPEQVYVWLNLLCGWSQCHAMIKRQHWNKGKKTFSISLSDKLEHKLICCMAGKRTAILPRSEKAGVSEKDRDAETESFVWWSPTCSSTATETQLLSFPIPLFVSVHHPRLFLCLLIPSTSPILIVFSFGDCSPRQVFIIFYYYIIIIIIFYRSLVPGN